MNHAFKNLQLTVTSFVSEKKNKPSHIILRITTA